MQMRTSRKALRILLIHPNDLADQGTWSTQSWDRIVDLGWSTTRTYQCLEQKFNCTVETIGLYRQPHQDYSALREIFSEGLGRFEDKENINWWETLGILFHQQLETIAMLRRFSESMDKNDQLFVTRECFEAKVLQNLCAGHAKVLSKPAKFGRFPHYFRSVRTLSFSQIQQIFWDKYDADYTLRSRIQKKQLSGRDAPV